MLIQSQAKLQEMQPQDSPFKYKLDGVQRSVKLLRLMIDLFKRRSTELNLDLNNKPKPDPKIIESVQDELYAIKLQVKKFANYQFSFESPSNNKDHEETVKQCFWLNILNFMTLFKLAEIRLTTPSILKQFKSFAIWQSFMRINCIEISGEKLSQEQILHSILRYKLAYPSITMLTSVFRSVEITNQYLRDLMVQNPNRFVAYGFFLPVRNMPMLRVFKKENLDCQLRCQVKVVNQGQLSVSPENFLVTLPKFMKWFARDFDNNEEQPDSQQSQSPLVKDKSEEKPKRKRASAEKAE